MSSRPATSGIGTATCRSKRPGLVSAGSSVSGRLVAAITMMPSLASKPSISTSIWLSVFLEWPPSHALRLPPTASISSTKTIQGAFFFAAANSERTRRLPTPTNISSNSLPARWKKGTPASPATARASSVLPVPGGPVSSTPLGSLPPRRVNFSGVFRYSTISSSSALASSQPYTSLKVRIDFSGMFSLLYSLGAWEPAEVEIPGSPGVLEGA
mmetsp:Transcript_43253/g.110667  ORF Transcript_43253/g.110667 Transcript_43253/m.110667 type:complete len:213 (-) Transcript_43253:277-915(-)